MEPTIASAGGDGAAPASEQQERASRLPKPKTAKEIRDTQYEGPQFTVEGLIPKGMTVLGGSPKSGKTLLATAIVLSVGSGAPLLGDIPVQRTKVLFISLEDSERRFQSRLAKLSDQYPATEDVLFINSWNVEGQEPTQLLNEYLGANPEIGLVIIDPLVLFLGTEGASQSGYKVEYQHARSIKAIADRHHLSIVVIHHTSKRGSDDWVGNYYGSFALPGAADALLFLDKRRGAETAVLKVTGRDVADQEIGLIRHENGCQWVRYEGTPEESCTSPEQDEILALLRRAGRPMQLKELVKATNKSSSNIHNILKKLVGNELVKSLSRGWYEAVNPEANAGEDVVDAEFTVNEDEDERPSEGSPAAAPSSPLHSFSLAITNDRSNVPLLPQP